MGEVYRARDTRLEREVAVKVLRTEVASEPDRLRRFEREARTVAALNHPHILTVHDVGTHGGTPYVVTELLEGETPRQVLKSRSPTQRQILSFAVQIARGLAAAHDNDIVHRDLKPESVFLTTDGRIKILDFGLAKLAARESDLRSAGTLRRRALDEPRGHPGHPGHLRGTDVRTLGSRGRGPSASLGECGMRRLRRRTVAAPVSRKDDLREGRSHLAGATWERVRFIDPHVVGCYSLDTRSRGRQWNVPAVTPRMTTPRGTAATAPHP
jgi:serine/threonine protein kinase